MIDPVTLDFFESKNPQKNPNDQYTVKSDEVINVYAKIGSDREGIDYVPKTVKFDVLYQIKDGGRQILDANIVFSNYEKYRGAD